ncbi:MAG: hypothetical protein AB7F40_07145 [Victivallaceae bacterium]|nr:hypothetical protein [Victivallaceae bacterium]
MSNHVVIVRFDEETDKRIMFLRKMLIEHGYPVQEWPPHITIAAYENLSKELLCEWTSEFSAKNRKIGIALKSLSILPPYGEHSKTAALCLEPSYSKQFVDFYYSFHEKYEEYCTGIGWFNSIVHGNPIIHATIGTIEVAALQKAMELIFSTSVFGPVEVTALEVYTYPMALIERFDLMNADVPPISKC